MSKIKKIIIFVLSCIIMLSVCTLSIFAATSSNGLGNIKGEDTNMPERIEFALQGTITGMLMVFAVLGLLAFVVWLSKVVFYDIPRSARAAAKAEAEAEEKAERELDSKIEASTPASAPVTQTDDAQLVAVITAAIAATIEGSEEYKSQFASGFRVVSFKRADNKR